MSLFAIFWIITGLLGSLLLRDALRRDPWNHKDRFWCVSPASCIFYLLYPGLGPIGLATSLAIWCGIISVVKADKIKNSWLFRPICKRK